MIRQQTYKKESQGQVQSPGIERGISVRPSGIENTYLFKVAAQRVRGRKNREDLSPLQLTALYIHDRYGWGGTYGVQTNRPLFSHRGQ